MTSKVHFSLYCIIITIVTFGVLLTGAAMTYNTPNKSIILIIITVLITLSGLFYCPLSVSIDSDELKIRRLLAGDKRFKISDITDTDTCYPSAAGIRLCGSGGFFGYWGYFSDILIGQYFGYYADRSQCFYIRMKNKKQYVISCRNHTEIVKNIQTQINKSI